MPQTRGAWIALAAFVCVVLTIFTWFFFVSPKLDERADLASQEESLTQENDALEAKVAVLRAQFAKIDDYRAELSQLQVRIPTVAETEDLLDALNDMGEDHDVIVNEVIFEGGKSLVGDTVAAPAPTPTPTPADSKDAGKKGAKAPAPAPEKAPAPGWNPNGPVDLVTLPYKVGVHADYKDAVKFLEALQTSKGRFFLVGDPVIRALDPEQDGNTKELEVSFILYAFVLTENEGGQPSADPDAKPKKATKSQDNRFGVIRK